MRNAFVLVFVCTTLFTSVSVASTVICKDDAQQAQIKFFGVGKEKITAEMQIPFHGVASTFTGRCDIQNDPYDLYFCETDFENVDTKAIETFVVSLEFAAEDELRANIIYKDQKKTVQHMLPFCVSEF